MRKHLKKKTMKTNKQNQNSELKSRSEQLGTPENKTPETQTQTKPSRPSIDMHRRQANRALPTDGVLTLLRQEAPRFFELAEVVGKWVWIQFSEKQPPQVTSVLAELGFHWNNKRQAWQHPCGTVAEGSDRDPRQKYGSFFPADAKAA